MNKYIAAFILEKSIYIDKSQKYNKENPIPAKLALLLESCGYFLDKDLIGWISPDYEKVILYFLETYLEEQFGSSDVWKAVYKSPDDLPENLQQQLDDKYSIYFDPTYIDKVRSSSKVVGDSDWEKNNYEIKTCLKKCDEEQLISSISNLLSSPTPLNHEKFEVLSWALEEIDLIWPKEIKCKEILALALSKNKGLDQISSVNDILRLAFYYSTKSTIINKDNYKISLTNSQRKHIISLLKGYINMENINFRLQDAKPYRKIWSNLIKYLHYKPRVNDPLTIFFKLIFKKKFGIDFWSKIQKEYDKAGKNGSLKDVVNLFSQRPGELIRRYDSLLRRIWKNKDTEGLDILQDTLLSIQNIRPKVLFDLLKYYQSRNEGNKNMHRSYVDKRNVRHEYGTSLEPLDEFLIDFNNFAILSGLKNIWGQTKDFKDKKVYVNVQDDMELITKQENPGNDSAYPGEKIYFTPNGKMKFFTQWIDPDGTKDLDIHGYLIRNLDTPQITEDDYYDTVFRLSWNTDQYVEESGCIRHSGDVRHVKGNFEEYISVDFSKQIPYEYMIIFVQNFDSDKLSDLENYVGFGTMTDTIYRSKVYLQTKNLAGFLVNFKENYVKFIMEGTKAPMDCLSLAYLSEFIERQNLKLKPLVIDYVKAKGGIVVEEPEDDAINLTSNPWELSKLLLE